MPIKVLDKQVAELIAAGEFIERPASVVKELMENAIDAKATAVTVEITHGGMGCIRVTDNGCGIEHSQAPTAFLRHATSKISKEEDLNSIGTLGFRGEALSSICAVAKVELLTKRADSVFGTRVYLEGSEQLDFSEAGCADGTTVMVKDLFYNVPARLKFMKKDTVEAAAVTSVVGQTALSHPEISVRFIKDGKDMIHTPGNGRLLSAVFAVFGRDYAESLMPVEYNFKDIRVTGYVSDPMHGRKSRAYQHFFVNGRYVKNKVGTIAVEEAYKNSIMIGKFPAFVLRIGLEANRVDVNVHPAKTEIRFTDEREVYDAIYFAVKTAITANNSIKEIALKEDRQKQAVIKALGNNAFRADGGVQLSVGSNQNKKIPFESKKPAGAPSRGENVKTESEIAENRSGRIVPEDSENIPRNRFSDSGRVLYATEETPKNDEFMFIDPQKIREKAHPRQSAGPDGGAGSTHESQPDFESANRAPGAGQEASSSGSAPENDAEVSVIGEIFGTYILAKQNDVFIIIDKHAAHERIIFEALKSGTPDDAQILLAPLTVNLSSQAHAAFLENLTAVRQLGFEAEDFGGNAVIVRTVPIVLAPYNIKEIIEEIADNLLLHKRSPAPDELDDLYHSVACKAAVRGNDKNSMQELSALANRVCRDENIRYCPHGRPVLMTMTEYELKRKFGR